MLILPFRTVVALVLLYLHNRVFWLPKALPNREEGEPNRTYKVGAEPVRTESAGLKSRERARIALGQTGTEKARAAQTSTVAELARFFPEATPVRIPVQFTRTGGETGIPGIQERTVIEFGTSREVLFCCTAPLEFADVLRLRNSDGSLDTDASVVAVQYQPGATIVAARFLNSVPNWIVKP